MDGWKEKEMEGKIEKALKTGERNQTLLKPKALKSAPRVCVCVANSFRHGCDRYEQKSPTSIFKHLTARRWKGEKERARGGQIDFGDKMRNADERGRRGDGWGVGGCTGMQVGCEIARAMLERTVQLSPSDESRAFVATLQ